MFPTTEVEVASIEVGVVTTGTRTVPTIQSTQMGHPEPGGMIDQDMVGAITNKNAPTHTYSRYAPLRDEDSYKTYHDSYSYMNRNEEEH